MRVPVDWPKLVIVTGAGAGIGQATAEAFAASGATVVCADLDLPAAEKTVDVLRANGGEGFAYALDVADASAWQTFGERVLAEHGVADVLVNNAGVGLAGSFLEHSHQDWQRIVDVNVLGAGHGCRVIGAQQRNRNKQDPSARGHLVNVASASAFSPHKQLAAYAATKAAVLMLSESLRAETSAYGIGVSAVCPAFIATGTHEETAAKAGGGHGPELVAKRILKAVRRNKPVVPVAGAAWFAYVLAHLAPFMMRRAAAVDGEAVLARIKKLTGWLPGKDGRKRPENV
ncbi:SDR family NAD(P)-dependent oxidoreductase [Kibdelosporangium phytohabitans]|uniref:Short-chain dehydrogenase n=1 Tax=Kibdelosporangium phytohabitans TaxID=860235 RepID=A0A0N9HXV9_9PSEU|nr:SDR family NAD(P)-dependent oxidoreductase [Kibdelosporangium phytohabitans]ALG12165.1 hypothetical protein AOZ06_39650 [Kibdelosporangium phytohabitans]MBE1463689.1 NAD(P)-dependent dehydrogenase (short-subunit alcohol dehydrogenase family) [Kibdelosporangium phytohabitans]